MCILVPTLPSTVWIASLKTGSATTRLGSGGTLQCTMDYPWLQPLAYFIYLECCKGRLDASWKDDRPMTMKQFHRRLSKQMCDYKSYSEEYPGDEFLHTTTVKN
jgi:hypothetical protein